MPLKTDIGGHIRSDKYKYKENKCLTEEQAIHIQKLGDIINKSTLKQEIYQDQE